MLYWPYILNCQTVPQSERNCRDILIHGKRTDYSSRSGYYREMRRYECEHLPPHQQSTASVISECKFRICFAIVFPPRNGNSNGGRSRVHGPTGPSIQVEWEEDEEPLCRREYLRFPCCFTEKQGKSREDGFGSGANVLERKRLQKRNVDHSCNDKADDAGIGSSRATA